MKCYTGTPCELGSFGYDQLKNGRMVMEKLMSEKADANQYIACVEADAQIALLRHQNIAALTYLCNWFANESEEGSTVEKVKVLGIMVVDAWHAYWTYVHGLDEGLAQRWLINAAKNFNTAIEGISWLSRSWTAAEHPTIMMHEMAQAIKTGNDAALNSLKKQRAELEITLGIHFTTPNTTEDVSN